MAVPVSPKRRPSSLTPSKLRPSTGGSSSNRSSYQLSNNRSPLPPDQRSSSRRRSETNTKGMRKHSDMLQLSFSEESNLIDSLLNDLAQEKDQKHNKDPTTSVSTTQGNTANATPNGPNGENVKTGPSAKVQVYPQQRQQQSRVAAAQGQSCAAAATVAEAQSFDTASTTPYNEMNVSIPTNITVENQRGKIVETISTDVDDENTVSTDPLNIATDSKSGIGGERSNIDTRGSSNKDMTAATATTLTGTFDNITRVCATQMAALKETKKKMDSTLEGHLRKFAAEMQIIRTKAEADAMDIIDQYAEKNKALEQQLATANCNVDLMKKKIEQLDQNRKKNRAETEEVKEELRSAQSLVDLKSQELKDISNRLEEQSKVNMHKEEQLNIYHSQIKALHKQIETAHMEHTIKEERLMSANEELSLRLDEANSENQRLEEKMNEAHAKLVSLADAYKKQQRNVTTLEQRMEDNALEAYDKLKAAMNRCLDAESRLELTRSSNEKLKKKLQQIKDLYHGEVSKCNKAAEAYRAKKSNYKS
jgi:hypothetical protein